MELYYADCSDHELSSDIYNGIEGSARLYRGTGFLRNQTILNLLQESSVQLTNTIQYKIVSNDDSFMARSDLFYSDALQKWQIFLWKDGTWTNIHDLIGHPLDKQHNIRDIYALGGFKF